MALKVMTIVGTRPELIKLSRVIAELDARLPHVLVHTGQNFDYELNKIFFEQLEIRKPDHFLEVAAGTPAQAIANVIAKSDEVLAKENPDALLLLGDTNSCLSAITAKRRKIPIFHNDAKISRLFPVQPHPYSPRLKYSQQTNLPPGFCVLTPLCGDGRSEEH